MPGCKPARPRPVGPVDGGGERVTVGAMACSIPDARSDHGLVVGTGGLHAWLVLIAAAKGYFADRGLAVEVRDYAAGRLALEDLLAGQVALAAASEFAVMVKCLADPELRILASLAATKRHLEVVCRKDRAIASPSDLAGRTVGVTFATDAEYFLHRFLARAGLGAEGPAFVDLRPPRLGEALLAGAVDAAITWEPTTLDLKAAMGDGLIAWPAQGADDGYAVLVARRELVATKPAAIEAMMAAMVEAEAFAREQPRESKAIVGAHFGLDPAFTDRQWAKFRLVVDLPEGLAAILEAMAKWRAVRVRAAAPIPDFRALIDARALLAVKPDAVTFAR